MGMALWLLSIWFLLNAAFVAIRLYVTRESRRRQSVRTANQFEIAMAWLKNANGLNHYIEIDEDGEIICSEVQLSC